MPTDPRRTPRPLQRGRFPRRAGATAAEKAKATKIVERSGIPFPAAILVVRGTLKLNDVLNEMFARERRDKLVKDGVDGSLAGQVARGRLDIAKARKIQTIWSLQGASFHSDTLKTLPAGAHVAVALFGRGMVTGVIHEVSRYEIRLLADGAAEPESVRKHDIKFYCLPEHILQVAGSLQRDDSVATLGLASSASMGDRFRPNDDMALEWVPKAAPVRFLLRDGDVVVGKPVRVARYEVEVDVGEGVRVCVMTHALLKARPFEVLKK